MSTGGTLNTFQCAFLCMNKAGKWAATHNCFPNEDSDDFRFDTPEEAWNWYQSLRT